MSGGPQFPANPTVGQIYTYGTTSWQWNGTQWVNATAGQNFLPLAGGTMTGPIVLSGNGTAPLNPVSLQQLQAGYLPLAGGNLSGDLTIATRLGTLAIPANAANAQMFSQFITLTGANAIGFNLYSTGSALAAYAAAASGAISFNSASPQITLQLNNSAAAGATPTVAALAYLATSGFWISLPSVTNGTGFAIVSQTAGNYSQISEMVLTGSTSTVTAWVPGSVWTWPVTSGSDRRLKSNIVPCNVDALAILNQLPIYSLDLKPPFPDAPLQHWDCAFIADELIKLIPDAVVPHELIDARANAYDMIRDLPIIATLIRAVQQLSAEVAALKGATP